MSLFRRLWYYLRRSRFDAELSDELAHHLDLAARQAEADGYSMNTEVDLHYDEYGTDNVAIMQAYGCTGCRVRDPGDLAESIEWARKTAGETSRPVLVEAMIEREADTARGGRIDGLIEPEPVPFPEGIPASGSTDRAGQAARA